MQSDTVKKLALLGSTGVGKDTFVDIFRKYFPNVSHRLILLAQPLYEVQQFIYKTCSKVISEDGQDGLLLNFLGKHLRIINPNVLLDRFAQNLSEIDLDVDLILCSDVRPADAEFVREMGFTIVHITADSQLAQERRKKRGDFSLGNHSHETETGILKNMYDVQINNNSTLENYELSVVRFLKEFLA